MNLQTRDIVSGIGWRPAGREVVPAAGDRPTENLTCRVVDGVVLAGVHSWGNGVLETLKCRPLLPVLNRPLISHVLSWLRAGGVENVTACANSDTGVIRRALEDATDADPLLRYYEDVMPRGPAGCARDAVEGSDADIFVVVEGAVIPAIDLRTLVETHIQSKAALTLVVTSAQATTKPGRQGLEPLGIYIFSRDALTCVSPVGYQDIKEGLIPALNEAGKRVLAYTVPNGSVARVSGAASYLATIWWALGCFNEADAESAGYHRLDDSWVHETATVDSTVRLAGPVLVGPHSIVQSDAVLAGPTTIGARCAIERGALVSRSVLWNGVHVGARAVLDRCVVADDAVVEPDGVLRDTVWQARQSWSEQLLDRLWPPMWWPRRAGSTET